ncbi:MAG: S8 family serine peptidase, partial [Kiritimatiellae bacterium]|nr:S8 family serine peptidase [Kiritimatiellia bacterium]
LARARKSADEERAAYVVQFPGPITEEWRTWLESATQVRGYLPEFAYLVWATTTEMETIAANPDVFWTGEWKKEYKTVCAGTSSAAKNTASASTADEARWMQIGSLLTDGAGAADLRTRLEALPATVRSAFPRIDGSSAVAFLTDAQIDEVASWPDVEWIEPQLRPRLFNDKAALPNMMNVAPAWEAISAGGLGLTGTTQIVAVADTGCDMGSTNDIHPVFAGRVQAGYGWSNGNYKTSFSWMDTNGHGTHVCGSVLGSGAASTNLYRGMAWEARLVVQGCGATLGGIPDDPFELLKQAHQVAGAYIHSDSWGDEEASRAAYTSLSAGSDGYMWTNQNFIMVIAAGNDGIDADGDGVVDAGSVSAPGTAKNCICVGASENYRSFTATWGGAASNRYPAAPIQSDPISQTATPQGIAAFSSRGPTLDGRFKPDIVAPGTHVISVRSRATTNEGWGVAANTNYIYEGGTSMATPLTAGALALVRQWLVDRQGIAKPPAALMKALLINGARDMTPGQYGTGSYKEITARPDRSQGFGHVNLYNSLEPGDGRFLVFATDRIAATGAAFTTNFTVGQANAGPYVLTLAWQDYPGDVGAEKVLVNDLDLTVTSPSGTVFYPNNLATNDRLNNVEFIEFSAPEKGPYTVTVSGYNVPETRPYGSQPFALVMRGPETSLAPVFSTSATNAAITLDRPLVFRFDSLLAAGYPPPTYELVAPSDPCDAFDPATGELRFAPDAPGTNTFTCTASNDHGSATCTLEVTARIPFPAVPSCVAFTDVATDAFTVTWSNDPYADSYRIDVVEGGTFHPFGTPPVLEEHFDTTNVPAGWDIVDYGAVSTGSDTSLGSPPYNRWFRHPNHYAVTPDFGSGATLEFWTYSKASDRQNRFTVSGLVARADSGGIARDWKWIAEVPLKAHSSTNRVNLPAGTSKVGLYFTDRWADCALDDVIVHAPLENLPGWSDATVDAATATVTGLRQATTYSVRIRAVNATGIGENSDPATVTTRTNAAYLAWLDEHNAPGHSPYETAPNAHTYWDNYLANIDPTNPFLEIILSPDGTFTIDPFFTNRFYQFLYYTHFLSAPTNIPLTHTNLVFPTDATGFGRLRV